MVWHLNDPVTTLGQWLVVGIVGGTVAGIVGGLCVAVLVETWRVRREKKEKEKEERKEEEERARGRAAQVANLSAQKLFTLPSDFVAVITGGGTGLGLMMARTLIYNNVKRVYILGSVSFELSSAIRSLPSPLDARVVPIICDITSKDELNSAVRKIKTQEGYINFLIVNAGISGPSEPGQELADDIKGKGKAIASSSRAPTTFDELEMDDFTKTPEFNTTGARRTVLAFLPLLEEGNKFRPRGSPTSHILFTASASAVTRTFADKSPAYAASRAANLHLMKILSAYSAERGWHSRMNAFLPGMGATPMTAGLPFLQGQNGKKSFEGGGVPKEVSPAERILGEEDVAGAVLYLCSKAGEMLDGCVLLADGGRVGVVPVTS